MGIRKKASKNDDSMSSIDQLDETFKSELQYFWRFTDENHLLLTGFVLLLCAMVIINTIFIVNHFTKPTQVSVQAASYSNHVINSGLTARTPAFNVSASQVYETTKTDMAFPIAGDQTMLIFTITITNNQQSAANFYPVNQLYIRDQEGSNYAPHASMYVTNPIAAQLVPPHKTITGQISFAIPNHLSRPLLYVDLGWGTQVPVVFDILH